MKQSTVKSLLAGAAGGLTVSVVLVLYTAQYEAVQPIISGESGVMTGPGIFSFYLTTIAILLIGLYGVILLLAGALAVWLARAQLHEASGTLKLAGISGVTASVIWIVSNALITLAILQFFYVGTVVSYSPEIRLSITYQFIAINIGCYSIAFLVMGTGLALIGGSLCAMLAGKKELTLPASGAS